MKLTQAQLDALRIWPKGTQGHARETLLLNALNDMGEQEGYGRLAQLAALMQKLVDHPELQRELETEQAIRFQNLKEYMDDEMA